MDEKTRLTMILKKKRTDRPACICPGGMMNMITGQLMDQSGVLWPQAHTDPELMAKLAAASYESQCFDNIGVPFCMTVEAEAMGAKVNLGSKYVEPHVEEYVIDSVSQWKELKKADFHKGRGGVVLDAIKALKRTYTQVPIIGSITGPVSTASSLMEPTVFYKELRKKPEDAHSFLNFVTEQTIDFANAQILAGADIIAISDPSGTGEILGPKLFEQYTVAYMNQLLNGISPKTRGTIVHICGQMKRVYEQVDKIHSDALSFDSIVPMKEAREHLPQRVLMGNVSTYALEFGSPAKVASLTKHCVSAGADILAPACGLGTKSPLANIQAMKNVLQAGG